MREDLNKLPQMLPQLDGLSVIEDIFDCSLREKDLKSRADDKSYRFEVSRSLNGKDSYVVRIYQMEKSSGKKALVLCEEKGNLNSQNEVYQEITNYLNTQAEGQTINPPPGRNCTSSS